MSERLTTYHSGKAVIKDKNKLSEAMEKLAEFEEKEKCGEWLDAIELAKIAIALQNQKWIPCSERLPEKPKRNRAAAKNSSYKADSRLSLGSRLSRKEQKNDIRKIFKHYETNKTVRYRMRWSFCNIPIKGRNSRYDS